MNIIKKEKNSKKSIIHASKFTIVQVRNSCLIDYKKIDIYEVTNGMRANLKYFARGSPQLKKA